MACGAPVIASSTGPIPELVVNPKYMCEPTAVNEWALKIKMVLSDREFSLAASKHGVERAQHFSWESCASNLRKVYGEVAMDNASR